MRIAIIDLGTNSVRFDVHQLEKGGIARELHREKLMVRLGQGVFIHGRLDPQAIRRTVQAFQSFRRTIDLLRVEKVVAFGTSALREAADSPKFIQLLHRRTGIHVRIIPGDEEARLIAQGILQFEKLPSNAKDRYALIDIGGGSTEISTCGGRELMASGSFPLGTARLQQVFLKSNPPVISRSGKNPIEELRHYIRTVLESKFNPAQKWKARFVMGSSGAIRTLCKILRKAHGGSAVRHRDLKKLIKMMQTMNTTQLLGITGMDPKRVDLVLAGAILLDECMSMLGADKFSVTDYSLRDGILSEEVRHYQRQTKTAVAFHMDDLYAKARRLGSSMTHIQKTVQHSQLLFDRLQSLHKLNSSWKVYLTAAAILHDTGKAISPADYPSHSFYIVQNAEFPYMQEWETNWISRLCLHHAGGKISVKDLAFIHTPRERQVFLKLLALLRIADALDAGHLASVEIRRIQIERSKVRLSISSKVECDLEMLHVDRKKELFEKLFRPLIVARVNSL